MSLASLYREHGRFMLSLARGYVRDGKQYSKDTPVQRRLRSEAARNALRKWRDGKWDLEHAELMEKEDV